MKILSRIMPATLALCLALLATSVSAQTATTGTIEGTVTDPNGASRARSDRQGVKPEPDAGSDSHQ